MPCCTTLFQWLWIINIAVLYYSVSVAVDNQYCRAVQPHLCSGPGHLLGAGPPFPQRFLFNICCHSFWILSYLMLAQAYCTIYALFHLVLAVNGGLTAQITYIYKEYHSVCPLVGIGTLPTPLSPACVPFPPEPGEEGGGHTCPRVRGWESPNSDDWSKSLALCLLCA